MKLRIRKVMAGAVGILVIGASWAAIDQEAFVPRTQVSQNDSDSTPLPPDRSIIEQLIELMEKAEKDKKQVKA